MIAVATVALAFAPTAPLQSRTAVRSMPQMSAEGDSTRRDLFAKAGAALLSFSAAVQGASAKAGQSGKIGIFDTSISSPYQPQGIARTEAGSTYGMKSNGEAAAAGYKADVAREKALFQVTQGILLFLRHLAGRNQLCFQSRHTSPQFIFLHERISVGWSPLP